MLMRGLLCTRTQEQVVSLIRSLCTYRYILLRIYEFHRQKDHVILSKFTLERSTGTKASNITCLS